MSMTETETMDDDAQSTLGRFRRRPTSIDAMRITQDRLAAIVAADGASDVPKWVRMASCRSRVYVTRDSSGAPTGLCIETPNGPVQAEAGEWLARGGEGELYPIRDSVFRATYERAD